MLETLGKDKRPHLKVSVFGVELLGLLDSAASSTVLGKLGLQFISGLGLPIEKVSYESGVRAANGEKCECLGMATLPICLMDKCVLLKVLIVLTLPHCLILGIDFWSKMGIGPDLSQSIWHFSPIDVVSMEGNISDFECSSDQRKEMDHLVEEYFNILPSELGCTNIVSHKIEIEPSDTLKLQSYPVSPKIQECIDAELDKMLKQGVVEFSNSPWSFPVVMIRKKDNSYRFCVDYRGLNKITKRDAYPLPLISSVLDKLRSAKYLSALDVRSVYWQVPVEPNSRQYTAFSVPRRGLFQFSRMPFGLTNAPATFQRLMDRTIGHDLEPYVFQYLDDLIVVIPTFEQHLEILSMIFDRLKRCNLVLSKEKCQFCLPRLKYLGFVIDASGLHVDPDKVSAIFNIPTPKNVSDVRKFLGMASWYRRFVPHFSTLTTPLTRMLSRSRKWEWSDDCKAAF